MTFMLKLRGCALAALLTTTAGVACEDTSTPIAICKAHGHQVCRAQFVCCAEDDRGDAPTLFGDVDPGADESECRAEVDALCDDEGDTVDEAVDEGRMTFHADLAEACLERTKGAVDRCDPTSFIVVDEGCAGAVAGNVADGSECEHARECREAGSECTDGECRIPGSAGDPCTNDLDCRDSQHGCREDVCVELGQLDATCRGDLDCAPTFSCLDIVQTEPGVFEGTCVELPEEGGDCDPFADRGCVPDSYCDDRPDFDGIGVCRLDGVTGDTCRDNRECPADAFCDLAQGLPVCVDDGGTGDACRDDAECSTAFCDFTIGDGTCIDEDGVSQEPEPDFSICTGA